MKGFYIIDHVIYYGSFLEDDISGYTLISRASSNTIDASCTFLPEDDKAMHLYDNHAATSQQIDWISACIKLIRQAAGELEQQDNLEFGSVEERIRRCLPEEIKELYLAIKDSTHLVSNKAVETKERFLSLEEMYLDQDCLVFYKIKRTPVAISLTTRRLMRYYKKNWYCELGDVCFFHFILGRAVVHAITHMPVFLKAKIKGELRSMLKPQRKLKDLFKDKLTILQQYYNYGNIILYNSAGALGWFRQNGFYADFIVGCQSEELGKLIRSVTENIEWESI